MRRLSVLSTVVVLLMSVALPALGHATLVETDPVDGARLEQSPDTITVVFDEPVAVTSTSIRVYNSSGARMDRGDAGHGASNQEIQIGLPDLPVGAYVVSWQAVSADGHPVRGAFVFEVGDSGEVIDESLVESVLGDGRSRPFAVAGWILRWATYLAGLMAAGAVIFHHRLLRSRLEPIESLVRWAVVVGIVASVLQIPVFAAETTGLGWSALSSSPALQAAFTSSLAVAALVRIAALVALLVGLRRGAVVWSTIGVVGVVAAELLTGHTRTTEPTYLVVTAAAVHLFAAAIWIGGLAALAVSYRTISKNRVEASRLVAGFSTVAAWSLVPLIAGGLALAWIQVGSWDALTSTPYGRTLTAKTAVAVVVLLVAAYNNRVLVPTLATGGVRRRLANAWERLGKTIRIEFVGLVMVIGATALLVNIQPAISAVDGPQSELVAFGSNQLNLVVDPARVGSNEIHIYITTPGGLTPLITGEVALEMRMPSADIGPIIRFPRLAGPAHFLHTGTELTVAGPWEITVRHRASEFEEVTAVVPITVRR